MTLYRDRKAKACTRERLAKNSCKVIRLIPVRSNGAYYLTVVAWRDPEMRLLETSKSWGRRGNNHTHAGGKLDGQSVFNQWRENKRAYRSRSGNF